MAQERSLSHDDMVGMLDWYRAAGVDIAVGEEPVDRFGQRPPMRATAVAAPVVMGDQREAAPAERVAAPAPALGGDPAEARALAASA